MKPTKTLLLFLFFLFSLQARSDTWLGKAWRFVTAPVRPVWGDYRPPYRNYQTPLTLFRRGSFESDRQQIINEIKKSGSDYQFTYGQIFSSANASAPGWGNNKEAATPNAAYVKNCAFVYVMGVDAIGDPLSWPERDAFAMKAMAVLDQCYNTTDNSWFSSNFNGGDATAWNDINHYRGIDLVNYCVAYELMRTGGKSVADLYFPRKQIKQYATDMFKAANRPFSTLSGLINNNLVHIVSAGLVMAAMVCHEEGDYLWNLNRHPAYWINVGMARIQESEFSSLIHTQSEFNEMAGHREGPGYYAYAMEALLPMFVAYNNFVGEDPNRTSLFYDGFLPPIPQRVHNPLHNPSWNNTFTWYNQITMPNGCAPTYDDTKVNAGLNVMAVTRHPDFLVAGQQLRRNFSDKYDDRADFLAANYQPLRTGTITPRPHSIWLSPQSGNAVMKGRSLGQNGAMQTHYLHALAETDFFKPLQFMADVVNAKWGHEHADAGSFSICAGDEQLMIDPPYMGYGSRDLVRYGHTHNLVTVDGYGPNVTSFTLMGNSAGNPRTPNLSQPVRIATNSFAISSAYENCALIRAFKMYNPAGSHPYYEIFDKAYSAFGHTRDFRLNLNGNGTRGGDNSCDDSRLASDHSVIWDYPCKAGRNSWGILAKVNVTAPGSTPFYAVTDGHVHGNEYFNPASTGEGNLICSERVTEGQFKKGYHSRLEVEVTARSAGFQTLLLPLTCENIDSMRSGAIPYPALRAQADTNYNYMVLDSLGADNLCNLHLASGSTDTVSVPDAFLYGDFDFSLTTSAYHTFLSYSHNPVLQSRGCVSNTGFRAVSMENGYFVSMNDTAMIQAEDTCTISYELSGKFKYTGSFTASDSTRASTTVTLFMPDLEMNYPMVARDAETMELLDFEHSELLNYQFITVTFNKPSAGFILELAEPCLMSCFFPSTLATIDTLFDFYEGTTETLGHNLDIVKDSGWLHISNGSKMSICPDYYLYNRDSITMVASEAENIKQPFWAPEVEVPGGSGITDPDYLKRFGSGRSMIIVNNRAALILDNGSYTHVGAGATILIKRGGTFLVRKGATLEIGNNNPGNYGEVIVEPGAYVCIEDSSDLHFFVTVNDTNDKNVFFIPVDKGVNERVNLGAINGEFGNGGRFDYDRSCLPLCSLWYFMPGFGVNNPDFGTNSVGKPEAFFTGLADTICYMDTLVMLNAQRSRNEAKYRITVTRDGLTGVEYFRQEEHPYQLLTSREPVNIAALGTGAGTLRFKLVVENTCGDSDVFIKTVVVPQAPAVSFTLSNDTVCPGTGMLYADGSASTNGGDSIRHIWSVSLIDSNQYAGFDTSAVLYGGDWEYTSMNVDDSFNFPGFTWLGGFRYAVSLRVFGACGDEIFYWDTLNVPLAVNIDVLAKPSVYRNPLGPSALQLNGMVSGATSWSWSPTTDLSNPAILDPLATPDTAVTYRLTAIAGSCSVSDSVVIAYKNHMAFAGDQRLTCAGDSIGLGTDYSLAALLGAAYASHPAKVTGLAVLDMSQLSALFTESYGASPLILCEALRDLLFDEKFLNAVIEHPAFASYYAAFLQNPANTANYSAFAASISPMNELYVLSQATTAKYNCITDFLEDLYDKYNNCTGGYRRYPDIDKQGALVVGALHYSDPALFASNWNTLETQDYLFPAYMAGFIQSTAFGSLVNCSGISALLSNPDLDAVYYEDPGFNAFYDTLITNPGERSLMDIFSGFVTNTGGQAQDYITTPGITTSCINEFFTEYRNWVATACISAKTIVWEKKDAGTWEHLPQWDGYYNIYNKPVKHTEYRITVVDMADNSVEYDVTMVETDTPASAMFFVGFQEDSTVYFSNYTQAALPAGAGYLWVFGDGDSSTLVNPVHTFAQYDTTYVVCLYATNTCGTSLVCDTITIDSLTAAGFMYGKKGYAHEHLQWEEPGIKQQPVKLSNKNILGNNRPNPFNDITEIDYELVPEHSKAHLQIINMLGQESMLIPISALKGTLQIDAGTLQAGIYYYSLIVDGIKACSKIMVVK